MNPKAPIVVVIAGLLTGEVLIPERRCDLAAPPESAMGCETKRERPHIEPEALRLEAPLPSGAPPLPTDMTIGQIS
jgi:hypothetical protein